ncbi:pancreatic lipase-related protein 2-like [Pelobates fuscus]|uniref:pancreatic lipase-related protein 2-like n=1 Tax=Pelobates fuscus TaxID=191477 RepID=UPI002FE48E1C
MSGKEVCFSRIGCFTDDSPWAGTMSRPIRQRPWSPEQINTHILLYTKENPNDFQVFNTSDPVSISASGFKSFKLSRFIVHGFLSSGEEDWLSNMCKAMLQVEDVNCFCVDWRSGSRALYSQAANNVRVVGAEVAYFIKTLMDAFRYSPSNIHIIGHSLGAHVAGEVGKRRPGIARITGLDPAEPYFQRTPIEVRLDPSDADFVDVIHTDGSSIISRLGFNGYGMSQSVGHMDFYPNGGKEMPGCGKKGNVLHNLNALWQENDNIISCNHLRSYKYYMESILNKDGFIGFPADSYEAFTLGAGFPCPSGGCPLMGHYADEYKATQLTHQKFYLNTGSSKNFSRWRYKVTIEVTITWSMLGHFEVSLYGIHGNTEKYQIYSGFVKTDNYSTYIDVEKDVGPLTKVMFFWDKKVISIVPSLLTAETVTVQYGKDGKMDKFCGNNNAKERVQTLQLCC